MTAPSDNAPVPPQAVNTPGRSSPSPALAVPRAGMPLPRAVRWGGPLACLGIGIGVTAICSSYWQLELTLFAFWAAVGMSWNLIGGYTGQLNLGHAAFIGLGAYGVAFFVVYLHINPWVGLIVGAAASALMAWVLGLVTVRIYGLYLGMASIALPSMLAIVFQYIQGQFLGFQETPIPTSSSEGLASLQWSSSLPYFILFALMAALMWYGMALMDRSRWRIVLRALREDESAATSLGIHAGRVKIIMFVISAALAGVAGAFYAELLRVVTPTTMFNVNLSVEALAVCLIGGLALRSGPLVGAFLITAIGAILDKVSGSSGVLSQVIYGAILIAIIILYPRGIVPAVESFGRRLARRWMPAQATPAGLPALALLQGSSPKARTTRQPAGREPHGPAMGPLTAGTGQAPASSAEALAAVRNTGQLSRMAASTATTTATPGDRALLCARHIAKRYGGVTALKDVSLELRAGEFLGIVGPNGAGKSTLFDILTGYQRPSDGEVEIAGRRVTGWAPDRIAELGIRRSFQTPRPFGDMTVLENVATGAVAASGNTVGDALASARTALERVGLIHLSAEPAHNLVAAQLRLLEVARALAALPHLVFLDEPLAGLEAADRHSVMSLLLQISQAGTAVVIVDHDVGAVAERVRRLVVMDRGVVLEEGTPAEALRSPAVHAAYLGEGGWQRAADQ